MVVPAGRRGAVVAALRAAHPYEEPAFDLLAQAPLPTRRGTGRIGELPAPMSLREFTAHAAAALPATAWGVRAAGDPGAGRAHGRGLRRLAAASLRRARPAAPAPTCS